MTSGYLGNQQPRNNYVSHNQTGTRLRDSEGRQLCRDSPQHTAEVIRHPSFLYIWRFSPWTLTFCLFVTPANNNAWIIQPIKRHLTESMNQVFGLHKLDSREQMKTFRPTADKQYLKVTAFRNKRAKKADRFQLIHTVIPEDLAETRSTGKSLSRSHSQGTGWPNGTRTGLKTRSSEWRVHVWSVLVQSVVSMYEEVTGGVSAAMCKTWRRLRHGSELFQPVYCDKLGQSITADLRTAPPWHMGSLAQLALPYKHVPAPPFSQKDNETNGYFPGSAQVHVPLAEHHKHRPRIVLHIWVCHVWRKKSAFISQLQAPTLMHTNTWCEFNWLT